MKLRFLLLSLLFTAAMFAQNGTVTGVILDKEFNNEPLPFANIVIKGTKQGASTDENGKYTISLKPGSYTLVIGYLGYETKEIPFTIKANEKKVINYTLEASGVQLNDVEIVQTVSKEKESALLQEQQKAVEIKQSIGAQELSRKGISNVETGLTKVTGITKVESRGLFIRGLEDRYNNLLINNLAVPSNSPFKKIIPLDLFPTDIVGYMDIFKTFNPNVYSDFAGATIDIHTTQPTENYTKLSYGVGYVTNNNMRSFLISTDANNTKSFFGFGGQERALPDAFGSVPSGQISNDFESSWNVDKIGAPLNTSFGVTNTHKFDLGKKPYKMYYFLSANFDNKFQYREGVDRTFVTGLGIYDNNLKRSQYKFGTQGSFLFSLNFKSDRLKVTTNSLFIKATENQIQDQIGYTRNNVQNPNEIIRLNQYDESNYFANQIQAEYKLTKDGKHLLVGGLSYTLTSFNQPDRKFINGTVINEEEIEMRYGSNNLIRQFLDVENNFHMSGILEYNYKFGKNEDKQNKLTLGYNGYSEYMKTSYRFIAGIPNDASLPAVVVNLNNIDPFIQDAVNNNQISFREETGGDYKTKIFNRVDGFYGNILFNLNSKLELNAGVRAENTIRELSYRTISDPIGSPYRENNLNKLDILPSLNLKYAVNEKNNIRFAASRTITRPVLFESLPITYINADGTSEKGNADLINSTNNNVDLKFEMFPTKDELFAVTAFGKYIQDPIERSFDNFGGGSGQQISYYNNEDATIFGIEMEAIIQLSRINQNLKGLSFGFNTSLMHTEANADTERTSYFDTFDTRQLQGASNWLVNSDLKYDFKISEKWLNTATLVYGVYGERIYAVGIAGLDHVYEKPFHKLDFIWSQNINKAWDVKLTIDNILNPYYQRVMGDESKIEVEESSLTVQDYKRGTGFSLGLSYKF
jgi:outer membrane receptor protein involved in Fe transport